MQYTRLGNTGLSVSRLCLGCMSYGDPDRTIPGALLKLDWALKEEAARPFFQRALELGINFFDTANVYSYGASEEVTGRALRDMARREEVVVATKVWGQMRPGPGGGGLSRKAILHEIDASLTRLGMDYVDLYQVHRWDPATPIEETMQALHDVVRAGKARYLGASSMWAWQFAKAQSVAREHGWTPFVSMQNQYNLLYREEERDMIPLCRDQGVGLIPWSPLARGLLARAPQAPATKRLESDRFTRNLYLTQAQADAPVLAAVDQVARSRGAKHASVALAWLLAKPGMSAPIVGATKMVHLDDAVAALDLTLSEAESKTLEDQYTPHVVTALG
jgi:aryl-alcohol dehydrogenase-like predicted oxidoreductase